MLLALTLASCGAPAADGIWADAQACQASAAEHCIRSAQDAEESGGTSFCDIAPDSEANAFRDFLDAEAPVGSPLETAFEGLERHGFRCTTGVEPSRGDRESQTYHLCRKDVTAGFLVTRNWIALINTDPAGRVTGHRINCGMTGP
jgi:hypothetical protein